MITHTRTRVRLLLAAAMIVAVAGVWLTICFWRQLPAVWIPGAENDARTHFFGMAFGLAAAYVAESLAVRNGRDSQAQPSIQTD